ncbi:hypothetical protein XM25_07965 [Devosia sp. H5989]|nr:hypothetical protein XM25_07965 [Devosia sp. H5989]
MESPAEELQRLFRGLAGKAEAGEKDSQLMARAARRMNVKLPPQWQIAERRARSYWYGEIDAPPSLHMDVARSLGAAQPLEEMIDAVAGVERYLEELQSRLAQYRGDRTRELGQGVRNMFALRADRGAPGRNVHSTADLTGDLEFPRR